MMGKKSMPFGPITYDYDTMTTSKANKAQRHKLKKKKKMGETNFVNAKDNEIITLFRFQ